MSTQGMEAQDTVVVRDVKTSTVLVRIGSTTTPLNYREAENLLGQLIRAVPGIPDAVNNAWKLRNEPRLALRQFYGVRGDEVIVDAWMAEAIDQFGNVLVRSKVNRESPEAAIAEANTRYGRELTLSHTFDSPGSFETAEGELAMKLITTLAEAEGITVAQLLKRARAQGEI